MPVPGRGGRGTIAVAQKLSALDLKLRPSLDVSADISRPSSHVEGTRPWDDLPPRPPPVQVQQLNSACCSCTCLLHGIQGNVCDGNPGFCMSLSGDRRSEGKTETRRIGAADQGGCLKTCSEKHVFNMPVWTC